MQGAPRKSTRGRYGPLPHPLPSLSPFFSSLSPAPAALLVNASRRTETSVHACTRACNANNFRDFPLHGIYRHVISRFLSFFLFLTLVWPSLISPVSLRRRREHLLLRPTIIFLDDQECLNIHPLGNWEVLIF